MQKEVFFIGSIRTWHPFFPGTRFAAAGSDSARKAVCFAKSLDR